MKEKKADILETEEKYLITSTTRIANSQKILEYE